MVVIFGFGAGKGEDQGEVVACVCPNCHNQVFLHHVRSKKSVRLYFVPVVPYGTDDYLMCPVCSRGLQLDQAQLPHVRTMAGTTAALRAGRYPHDQYMAQAERFWRQLGMHPAGQQRFPGPAPGPAPPAGPGPAPPAGPGPAPPAGPGPAPPAGPAPAPPAGPTPAPQAGPAPQSRSAPPAPSAPPAEDETSWVAQLRKLSQLHDQGVLSDEAYAAAKQRLLEQK